MKPDSVVGTQRILVSTCEGIRFQNVEVDLNHLKNEIM